MKILLVICVSVFLFPLSLYAGTINYEGSSTVGKFIADASKVYTDSTFKIDTSSESSGGEKCAMAGTCGMGGVARRVTKVVLKRNVVATLIGKDAIAVIVNSGNPVDALSSAQLRGIFTGEIKNWSEVGGADLPVIPMIVKRGSATRKVFQKVIIDGGKYRGCKVITPDSKIPDMVSMDKGAIGQISLAFIKEKKGIKVLAIDGREASVNNPGYPITRPLYIVTNGQSQGEAFLDWTLSPEGQKVLKQRFVGVK